jgi:hypothetical protein
MTEPIEEQNDYETFPYDSFVENPIGIDLENETEYEENDSEEATEIAETRMEITGVITEKFKSYPTSKVWDYFDKKSVAGEDDKIENYILCNICQNHLSIHNFTTTLERHLRAKHHAEYNKLKQEVEVKQSEPWAIELQTEKHNLFINWIITDQQPFTIVENKDFRKFLLSIQPKYKLPSRNTVKDMIIKKFKNTQDQIKNYLQLLTSKISLTIDMWTSITSLGILAVTIHFIRDD